MSESPTFKLSVTSGKKTIEIPISYESLASFISSYPDRPDSATLFELAASHPSSYVREQVAYKENLSEATVEILKQDSSINVLRCLARTESFRKYAHLEDVLRFVSLDPELAQSVASYFESYEQVEPSKIIDALSKSTDPGILYSLVSNYSTPKKVVKSFTNHADPHIAGEAKARMNN